MFKPHIYFWSGHSGWDASALPPNKNTAAVQGGGSKVVHAGRGENGPGFSSACFSKVHWRLKQTLPVFVKNYSNLETWNKAVSDQDSAAPSDAKELVPLASPGLGTSLWPSPRIFQSDCTFPKSSRDQHDTDLWLLQTKHASPTGINAKSQCLCVYTASSDSMNYGSFYSCFYNK